MARDFGGAQPGVKEAHPRLQRHQLVTSPSSACSHGPAVGAPVATGLLADMGGVSRRVSSTATPVWRGRGDHAAIVWPLLSCGMAKAKYYLLLCEAVSGEEAERIGLVSLAGRG